MLLFFFLKKKRREREFFNRKNMSKKNLVEKNFIRPSYVVPDASSCAPGAGSPVNYFFNAEPKAEIVRRRGACGTPAVYKAKISQAVFNGKFDRQKTVYRIFLNRLTENYDRLIHKRQTICQTKTVCHIVCYSLMDKPVKFPLKFFYGDDGSGQIYSENRRKIIFIWSCPSGAFFNCDFAPVFSLMSRARQALNNYLLNKVKTKKLRSNSSPTFRKLHVGGLFCKNFTAGF